MARRLFFCPAAAEGFVEGNQRLVVCQLAAEVVVGVLVGADAGGEGVGEGFVAVAIEFFGVRRLFFGFNARLGEQAGLGGERVARW